eukprot:2875258-Pleurochrysis_carterae.AAC.2
MSIFPTEVDGCRSTLELQSRSTLGNRLYLLRAASRSALQYTNQSSANNDNNGYIGTIFPHLGV